MLKLFESIDLNSLQHGRYGNLSDALHNRLLVQRMAHGLSTDRLQKTFPCVGAEQWVLQLKDHLVEKYGFVSMPIALDNWMLVLPAGESDAYAQAVLYLTSVGSEGILTTVYASDVPCRMFVGTMEKWLEAQARGHTA